MLEGVVTIILSAIMTALGFLVVRWLTSVDQKLQELEEGMREAKDQCKSAYSDFVSRGDFAAAMKEFHATDSSRRMSIDRLDRDISDLARQNRLLNHLIQTRSSQEESNDGKPK